MCRAVGRRGLGRLMLVLKVRGCEGREREDDAGITVVEAETEGGGWQTSAERMPSRPAGSDRIESDQISLRRCITGFQVVTLVVFQP